MRRLREVKTLADSPTRQVKAPSAPASPPCEGQKQMCDDHLPARSTSSSLLRLFEVPYSKLKSDASCLRGRTEEYISSKFVAAAGLGETVVVTSANLRKSFHLIYSKETLDGLRNGTYRLAINAKTKLPYATATNKLGQLVEHAKIEHVRSLANSILFAAALLASIETERQLVSINQKLDRLIDLAEAERDGRLRGVYESLARILSISDRARRERSLEGALETLHELSGIFFEGATRTLARVRDPDKIGLPETLVSLPGSERKKLKENLGSAFADYKRLRLCWFLQQLVVSASEDSGELGMVIYHQSKALADIRDALVQGVGYLDLQEAADLSSKLDHAIGAHQKELVRIGKAIKASSELLTETLNIQPDGDDI